MATRKKKRQSEAVSQPNSPVEFEPPRTRRKTGEAAASALESALVAVKQEVVADEDPRPAAAASASESQEDLAARVATDSYWRAVLDGSISVVPTTQRRDPTADPVLAGYPHYGWITCSVVSPKLADAARAAVAAAAFPTVYGSGAIDPALHAVWQFVGDVLSRAFTLRYEEAAYYGGMHCTAVVRAGCDTVRSACTQVIDIERSVEAWADLGSTLPASLPDRFAGVEEDEANDDDDGPFEPEGDEEDSDEQTEEDKELEHECVRVDAERAAGDDGRCVCPDPKRPGETVYCGNGPHLPTCPVELCLCCPMDKYSSKEAYRHAVATGTLDPTGCRRLHKKAQKYPPGSDEKNWLQYLHMSVDELPDEAVAKGCLPVIAFRYALAHWVMEFPGYMNCTGMTEAAADTLRVATERYIELSTKGLAGREPSVKTLVEAKLLDM